MLNIKSLQAIGHWPLAQSNCISVRVCVPDGREEEGRNYEAKLFVLLSVVVVVVAAIHMNTPIHTHTHTLTRTSVIY